MRFRRTLALAALVAGIAGRAVAQDRCSAQGTMEGKAFKLDICAVAFYPSQNSVAIWFMEKPLPAAALETFQIGSYANLTGTAMSFSFCPGGGKAVATSKAVKDVEVSTRHASSPMLSQSWVFQPGDPSLKFERLTGDLKPGSRLAGRVTGKKTLDQGQVYTWQADFDVKLPAKGAAAGLGCGVD